MDRNEAATRSFLGACSLGDTSLAGRLNPYEGTFLPLEQWLGQSTEAHDETKDETKN